jgi:hypothetical protein
MGKEWRRVYLGSYVDEAAADGLGEGRDRDAHD